MQPRPFTPEEIEGMLKVRNRLQREEERSMRRLEMEQRQRDMGAGYLVWIARQVARLSKAGLARRMGTSRRPSPASSQESQLPTLRTLENVAIATGLEIVVGLRDPRSDEFEFIALGAIEDEGNLSQLRMIVDFQHGGRVPMTRWRRRLIEEGYPTVMDVTDG